MSPPSDQDKRPRQAQPTRAKPPAAPTVELVVAADWVAPSIARDRVRRWLTALRWSPAQIDDLVLAVSEAVSNSVEHGYRIQVHGTNHTGANTTRRTVEVRGRLLVDADRTRRVEFMIRDHGRWIPPVRRRGNRGHGLTLLRACADHVMIDHTPDGTTVTLRSRPLPPPPLRLA